MDMDLFSLTANKISTQFLKNIVFYEMIDTTRITAMKINDVLLDEWGDDDLDTSYSNKQTQHDNEIQQMSRYLLKNKKNLGIEVKYVFGGNTKDDYGRTYPFNSLGLTTIRKKVRDTLAHDVYYDFDIINAQPSIMLELTSRNNLLNYNLRKYCENREEILTTLANHYGVDKSVVKKLFIRILFGGCFTNWARENDIQDAIPTDFIVNFGNEINQVMDVICNNNKKNGEIYAVKKRKATNNLRASTFAVFNQHLETSIVARVIQRITEDTALMRHPKNKKLLTGCYEYDGIRLLMNNVDCFRYEDLIGVNAVVRYLDVITKEVSGYPLRWANKPYGEIYELNYNQLSIIENELKEDKALIETLQNKVHIGVLDLIDEHYKDFYAFSRRDNKIFCWDEINNRYINSYKPIHDKIDAIVIPRVESIINKYKHMTNSNTEMFALVNDATALIKSYSTNHYRDAVVSMAKKRAEIEYFERDYKIFLLGFNNGVLDMENKIFRQYDPTDKITMSCGYDFDVAYLPNDYINKHPSITSIDTEEEVLTKKQKINNLVKSIQSVDNEREYFMKIHATALTGKAIERAFVLNGKGRNGKGVFSSLMCSMLGEYACGSLRQSIITTKDFSSSNSATEGLSGLKNARYAVMKEPPKNSKIQNSTLKMLTGGDKVPYRGVYEKESFLEPSWTLFLECNVKLYFEETPTNAEYERIRDLYYPNKFVSSIDKVDEANGYFLGDNSLKDVSFQVEHRQALLNILLGYLDELFADGFNVDKDIPPLIKSRTDAYLRESNLVLEMIRKHFAIDEKADPIKHKDIWGVIQLSKHYTSLIKSEKKEITSVSIKNALKNDDLFKNIRVEDKKNHSQKYRLRQIYDDDDDSSDDDEGSY